MVGLSYAVPLAPNLGTLCPLRRVTGVPCPFCGLTTGVVATTHGHLVPGLGANPLAPVLVLATGVGWMLWALRRSGRLATRWPVHPGLWRWARWALGPGLLFLWVFELHRFGYA